MSFLALVMSAIMSSRLVGSSICIFELSIDVCIRSVRLILFLNDDCSFCKFCRHMHSLLTSSVHHSGLVLRHFLSPLSQYSPMIWSSFSMRSSSLSLLSIKFCSRSKALCWRAWSAAA
jgi:hypothetical protein